MDKEGKPIIGILASHDSYDRNTALVNVLTFSLRRTVESLGNFSLLLLGALIGA